MTSTVSSGAPSSRCTPSVTVSVICTGTPSLTHSLKPPLLTSTRYVLGLSSDTSKAPAGDDTAVRVSPVVWSIALIVALPTTAPLGSAIVPEIAPVPAVCAGLKLDNKTKIAEKKRGQRRSNLLKDTSDV